LSKLRRIKMAKGEHVDRFEKGNIVLSIWKNSAQKDGRTIKILTFTISRRYFCKGKDKWDYCNYFGESDLIKIQEVINGYFSKAKANEQGGADYT
jgi:hypothetical protein